MNSNEDVPLILKGAADLHLHGTIESSTLSVKTTFNKVLNDTLSCKVKFMMAQKGWYPTQPVEQQKIDQLKQKYAQDGTITNSKLVLI